MLSKSILTSQLLNTSEIEDISGKLCGMHFDCDQILDVPKLANIFEGNDISPRSLSLKENLLFGRPLRKPENSEDRIECQRCEKKRRSCFLVNYFKV